MLCSKKSLSLQAALKLVLTSIPTNWWGNIAPIYWVTIGQALWKCFIHIIVFNPLEWGDYYNLCFIGEETEA